MSVELLNQITLLALSVAILVQVLTLRVVLKKIDLVLELFANACNSVKEVADERMG
nr:MAG TPA_asm: hypothetical protein [Caudoviricetes sp.]